MSRTVLRDAGVALSLSNLLFLKGWLEMLEGVRHPYFRQDIGRFWTDFAGLALVVAATGAIFWSAVAVARRTGRPALLRGAKVAFLLSNVYLLFLIANILRRQYPAFSLRGLASRFGETAVTGMAFLLLAAALYCAFRFRVRIVRLTAGLLLVFSPAVLLTFGKTTWLGWSEGPNMQGPTEREEQGAHRPARVRVVWFIFDNLDYRLSVGPDAPYVLPDMQRLLTESLNATDAVAPSPVTARSMTALLTGRRVTRAIPASANEIGVWFEGEQNAVAWTRQPNLFTLAREAGYRSAVIGWYHPYCRLLGGYLDRCAWWPYEVTRTVRPVVQAAAEFLRMSVPPWARLDFLSWIGVDVQADARRSHIEKHKGILDHARNTVGDPALDLVLIHWVIPHEPYIYDRAAGEYTLTPDPEHAYFGNLALVDETLGEMRSVMESSGVWEDTALVISSDHPWRGSDSFDGKRDERVPFIVRLPGQREAATFPGSLDTVVTRDLLLAIAAGDVESPARLQEWLAGRARLRPD